MFTEHDLLRNEKGELDVASLYVAISGGDLSSSVALSATPLEERFKRQGVESGVSVHFEEGQDDLPIEQRKIKDVQISALALKAFVEQAQGNNLFDDANDAVQVIGLVRSNLAATGMAFGMLERSMTMVKAEHDAGAPEISEKAKTMLFSQLSKALPRLTNLVRTVGALFIATQSVNQENKGNFTYKAEHGNKNALDELADATGSLAAKMSELLALVREVKSLVNEDDAEASKLEKTTSDLAILLQQTTQALKAA